MAEENPRKKTRGGLTGDQKSSQCEREGSESTHHTWGKTNPLKFPAHLYTKGVFKANQPLIEIVDGEPLMPKFDKFALPLLVDREVRNAAIYACSGEIARFFKLYGKAANEKQLLEFHHSLIRKLENLTIPSVETLHDLEQKQLLSESLEGKKRKRLDISELSAFSDQLEMLLDVAEDRLSNNILSSNHDYLLEPEDAPLVGEDDEESSGASDLKLYVLTKKLHQMVKKLVAVLEFKFGDKKKAGFQGACYACKEAPVNIRKEHTNPIYILALSKSWRRFILHLRGEVYVKDGAIDRGSLPAFRKTEQVMGFKDPIPEEELLRMLEERTGFLQKNYSENPQAMYPDGNYLVGTLHTSDKWCELPRDELCGGVQADTHRLYEGLLRVLVGDAVLKWNKEMVDKVMQVRREIRKEQRALLTGG